MIPYITSLPSSTGRSPTGILTLVPHTLHLIWTARVLETNWNLGSTLSARSRGTETHWFPSNDSTGFPRFTLKALTEILTSPVEARGSNGTIHVTTALCSPTSHLVSLVHNTSVLAVLELNGLVGSADGGVGTIWIRHALVVSRSSAHKVARRAGAECFVIWGRRRGQSCRDRCIDRSGRILERSIGCLRSRISRFRLEGKLEDLLF
jgi:hypothetical protein